ncbi:MAG: hypothetical protein K2I93_09200 [Oscillospiraceae bacterium]|nr:hypothetical protein [Oscillospiraceae bacterium]
MEYLRSSVLGACLFSAVVGICTLIRPSRALERQVRLLLSLLFVISLAAPLTQMELPESLEALCEQHTQAHAVDVDKAFTTQLLTETQQQTEAVPRERFTQAGITCTELSVTLYIDENDCIHCKEVHAVCDDFAGGCALLEELLGEEVTICVTEILS